MRKLVSLSLMSAFLAFFAQSVFPHCEIPCGIYGDKMRVDLIEEHIATIEKSMQAIIDLSAGNSINYNQLVRWIENKETHAEKIQEIVCQYFMNQRIKPVDETDGAEYKKYTDRLAILHKILVHAMKTKQTTDVEHVKALRTLVAEFKDAYFGSDQDKIKKQ